MANSVPNIVSGRIDNNQESILVSVIDQFPVYLVQDNVGVPYFQPMFRDPTTGLATFRNFASRVLISISQNSTGPGSAVKIESRTKPYLGEFRVSTSASRIFAPSTTSDLPTQIPLETFDYDQSNLAVCGFLYVLSQGLSFYYSQTWSPTPTSQSVTALPTVVIDNFFVFPVSGLVDHEGNLVNSQEPIFDAIYNDILGKQSEAFYFTNYDAWKIGSGLPFHYSITGECQGGGVGSCPTRAICERGIDAVFHCQYSYSALCKITATSPLIVIIALCLAVVMVTVSWRHHVKHGKGRDLTADEASKGNWVIFGALAIMFLAIFGVVMFINFGAAGLDWWMKTVCPVSREK